MISITILTKRERKKLKLVLARRLCKEDRMKFREYKSVRRWLAAIEGESNADYISDETETEIHYLSYLAKFCWFCQKMHLAKDPDDIIAKRIKDMKSSDIEKRMKFETSLRKFRIGYKVQRKLVAGRESAVAVKSFFFHNSLPLAMKTGKKVCVKVKKRLTIQEVKNLLKFCDARERAIVLLLLQSGARPETLVLLTYGHVKGQLESGDFPITVDLTVHEVKGGYAPYTMIFGTEACHALVEYIECRKRGTQNIDSEEITSESPLLRKIDSFEFIGTDELRKIIRKICVNSGSKKRITPYTFRRTFQTIMERHMPVNWVDRLMGHVRFKGIQGEAYSVPTLQELREAYKEAEPFISVSQTVPNTTKNSVRKEMLRGMAKFCGVDLDEFVEKKELKSLDEMTEEDVEALYKEYRKALRASGASPSQLESRTASDVKNCTDNSSSNAQVCPNCNSTGWKESDKFCGICGNPLVTKCPKCGKENSKRSNFCTQCGAKLACS